MLNAVEAGSDCIEHAEFLVPGEMIEFGGGVASSGRMLYDPAVTDRLADAGTYVSFTMQAGGLDSLRHLRQRADEGDVLSRMEVDRMSVLEAYFEMKLEVFNGLLRDGMQPRITISSDAGPYDVPFGTLHQGLELAVSAGMRPIHAIDAATRIAAEVCGVSSRIGTVEAGKIGDLLVVDGNPLNRIEDLERVRQVFTDGRPVLATGELAAAPAP
jgi:imidazolonepropionase-like amidohydrolase